MTLAIDQSEEPRTADPEPAVALDHLKVTHRLAGNAGAPRLCSSRAMTSSPPSGNPAQRRSYVTARTACQPSGRSSANRCHTATVGRLKRIRVPVTESAIQIRPP